MNKLDSEEFEADRLFPVPLPEEEQQYEKVRIDKDEAQTGPPRLTVRLYTAEDIETDARASKRYTFRVTEEDDPRMCAYQWRKSEIPVVVARAVYKYGYAIENARTFPAYTPSTTLLVEMEKTLFQKTEGLRALDVPLVPDAFERTGRAVRGAHIILRGRLVLTDDEWATACRAVVEELTGSPDTRAMNVGSVDDLLEIAKYVRPYVKEVLKHTRDDGEDPPDDVADPSLLEYEEQYIVDVDVREDDFIYVYLFNHQHIERFVFEKTGDTRCVGRRHHGKIPHAQAVTAVNEKTDYTVQGRPNFARWQVNAHDLIAELITTLESLGNEYDGPWFAGAALLFAADTAYDLQLLYAFADALGRDETKRLYDSLPPTGDFGEDVNAFIDSIGPDRAQQLRAEHDFLDRAVEQTQDIQNEGYRVSKGEPSNR